MGNQHIGLAELPRRLRADYGIRVTYKNLYHLVLNGDLPAKKADSGGRWIISVSDLEGISRLVGG